MSNDADEHIGALLHEPLEAKSEPLDTCYRGGGAGGEEVAKEGRGEEEAQEGRTYRQVIEVGDEGGSLSQTGSINVDITKRDSCLEIIEVRTLLTLQDVLLLPASCDKCRPL